MKGGGPFRATIVDCDLVPFSIEEQELAGVAELAIWQCRTEEQVIEAAREADALLVQYAPITERVLASLLRCRVVARYGVGIDMIDLAAARRHGITVCNVPHYCGEEVSDHACALMLALARKLEPLHRAVQQGRWDVRVGRPMHRLTGQVLGLLGFGSVARLVARKMRGFGMTIIACDPFVSRDLIAKEAVAAVSQEELFARSDILSIHAALASATLHLLGAKELRSLKQGAILVNTSRGGLIDENALLTLVSDGWLGGVGLDVLESEPPDPDHPLLRLENVIVTPHAAYYSETSVEELKRQTARAAARVLKGQAPGEGDSFAIVKGNLVGQGRRGA